MLLGLARLSVTDAFALLRLLPMSDRDKDVEILVLRHQITILERRLGRVRPRLSSTDRAFLAALLHRLPLRTLRRLQLPVRPETVLRLAREKPTQGYRHIHGELLVLGITIAASTVWRSRG